MVDLTKDIELPYKIEELIDILDQIYPEQCPDLSLSEKEIWFKSGQRSVVRWLISLKEEQEKNFKG